MIQFRHVKIGNLFRFADDPTIYQRISLLEYVKSDGESIEKRKDYLMAEVILMESE